MMSEEVSGERQEHHKGKGAIRHIIKLPFRE